MQINSTGGIFLRLDSSGNLNIFNTAGVTIAKFLTGSLSVSGNKGTFVSNSTIVSTTSTLAVDIGQSIQITPQVSTSIFVFGFLNGTSNSVAGDGSAFQITRATGTSNPAGGTTDNNLIIASISTIYAAAGSADRRPLSIFALDTGLTLGQAYTYSLTANATTGGTFAWSLGGLNNIGAFEL